MTAPNDNRYTPNPAYRIEPPTPPTGWGVAAGPTPPSFSLAGSPTPPQPSKRRTFWTRGPGLMLVIVAAGLLLFGGLAATGGLSDSPAASPFTVTIDSCEFSGSETLPTASVGLSVKNTSNRTRTAAVKIEYRDGSGARLDTDTAYVRDIGPGDTARTEESTLLDAASPSLSCRVVGVS